MIRSERDKRAEFVVNTYSDAEIVGIGIEADDYTDFYVDRNGDCECYRVRGKNGKYELFER